MYMIRRVFRREIEDIADQWETFWPRGKISLRFPKHLVVDKKSHQSN